MDEINTKLGYIYKITNQVNGKIYIGKRKSSTFDEEYWGSGTRLKVALAEFGKDNFKREIIEWCSTSDILKEREKYWIEIFNSRDPDIGYNIKPGGEGDRKKSDFASDKKIIGFQIETDIEDALLDMASEYGSNLSGVVRMILLDYLKRYKGFKPTRKERK